jgi:hypothetical protein
MNNAERYAAAHLPDTWRIMGLRLQPLTLGHGLLLARVGSPWTPFALLPTPRSVPPLGDLLLALWILAQPWRKAAAHLSQRRCRWYLRAWELQAVWLSEATLADHGDRLTSFILENLLPPTLWRNPAAATSRAQAPTLASLKVQLIAQLHLSQDAALDTPLAVAIWDLLTWGESQGTHQFRSESEAAAATHLHALAAN